MRVWSGSTSNRCVAKRNPEGARFGLFLVICATCATCTASMKTARWSLTWRVALMARSITSPAELALSFRESISRIAMLLYVKLWKRFSRHSENIVILFQMPHGSFPARSCGKFGAQTHNWWDSRGRVGSPLALRPKIPNFCPLPLSHAMQAFFWRRPYARHRAQSKNSCAGFTVISTTYISTIG